MHWNPCGTILCLEPHYFFGFCSSVAFIVLISTMARDSEKFGTRSVSIFLYNIFLKCSISEEFGEYSRNIYVDFHYSVYPLSDFNHKWIGGEILVGQQLPNKISRKYDYWKPNCSMRTDRPDKVNSHFSQLFREGAYRWRGECNRDVINYT